MIKFFSAFSGIGGMELGIRQARVQMMAWGKRKEFECVGYSEINKYAVQIYEQYFKHKNYGDITKIDERRLPDFELFCGGFPCQSFSIAGKRGGFEDTRGTLFFDIARIAKCKRPRLLLLENVKGLLSHDSGRTFNTIIAVLDELGYDLQWQVLNSKDFGVPQNRERIFIIGNLRGTPRPQVFPLGQGDRGSNQARKKERQEVAYTLRAKQGGPDLENSYFIQSVPHGHNPGWKKKLPNLRAHSGAVHNEILNGVRRLTPIEWERLQGFPDDWTKGISDTRRYQTLGNAVTVPVIREIILKMYE